MSLKHLTIGVLVAVCTFAAQAAAQKNELSGIIGRTFISNQGIPGAPSYDPNLHFGNGLTFEVNYARHVMGGEHLVPRVGSSVRRGRRRERSLRPGPDPRTILILLRDSRGTLNVFSEQAVSPWVSFGGGFGHFNESSTLQFGGPNPGKTGTSTGVLQGGVGLDVRIYKNFTLRGEGRDFWSGVPQLNVDTGKSRQHNIFAGGGIVWHF